MTARRPWRERKRWWAAALWLAVAYPASVGPAVYAVNRRWVSPGAYRVAYAWFDPEGVGWVNP